MSLDRLNAAGCPAVIELMAYFDSPISMLGSIDRSTFPVYTYILTPKSIKILLKRMMIYIIIWVLVIFYQRCQRIRLQGAYFYSNNYCGRIGNKEPDVFADLFSEIAFNDKKSVDFIKKEFVNLYSLFTRSIGGK